MNLSNTQFLPFDFKKKNAVYFYIPYLLLILWGLFSVISIFFVGFKNISDGFVLFSIIIRIIMVIGVGYFFKEIFLKQRKDKRFYGFFKTFVGYGVVFTYVFYSLPRLVGEFNKNIDFGFSLFNFIFVLLITIFPAVLYLLLRTDKVRITMEIYSQKEIEYEKKVKKDKDLKKQEREKVRSERRFFENLWYDWIDVIIQAIIIALIIQQFIFQMYQIPSESMVPTFVKGDRVVVNKAVYGPQIPLTDWKIPSPIKPKIGDIVVFKNPEMDDPNSDVSYKNVVVRIFHPFVYMLTLSMVDIDKRSDGSQKEKFIVKRLIADGGEKLCLVNDKVYKKTKDTKWTLMENIEGQREYGQTDLYYDLNPKMETQLMTKEIRNILNNAQSLVNSSNVEELKADLVLEKNNFLKKVPNLTTDMLKDLEMQIEKYKYYEDINVKLYQYSTQLFRINIMKGVSKQDIDLLETELSKYLEKYHYTVLCNLISDLKIKKGKYDSNKNYFINEINTEIKITEDLNPYNQYMKKVNALNKIYQLKLFSMIIDLYNSGELKKYLENDNNINEKSSIYNDLHKYYLLNIYLEGIPDTYISDIFDKRNFPEYPEGAGNYLSTNEYFVMGDNRYNSLDMRFGRINNEIFIDNDDKSDFSKKVNVTWSGHTIKNRHLLGKAVFIYYPFDRMKSLK
jgi:signal peptidase I